MINRFMMLFAIALVAGLARAETTPTLDVEFDYDFDGITANGMVLKARLDGIGAVRQPGKFDQALKSGPGFINVEFPAEKILAPQQGTVEMWVCPLDWDGGEEKHHVFFEANGVGSLGLFKHPKDGLIMSAGAGIAEALTGNVRMDISSWKRGAWHHIAGTWSTNGLQVYVDGKPSGTAAATNGLPRQLSGWFKVGDNPRQDVRTSCSLIDRVLIYDQALAAEEIAAHAVGNYEKIIPLARKEGVLSYAVDPLARKIVARLEERGAYRLDTEDTQAAFALTPVGQTATNLTYKPMQKVMTLDIPAKDLKPGNYDLSANIRQGTNTARLAQTVIIPSTEWKGNRLGLEEKVLSPWTPLKVVKRPGSLFNRRLSARVECWGRTYDFDNSGLPAQIVSRGEKLLAQPTALKLQIDGRAIEWSHASAEIVSASDIAVEIVGSASADSAQGAVVLKTHLRLEYDGLIVYQLRLVVPEKVKVDSLMLDIPLRSEVAKLRHRLTMADLDRGIPGRSSNGALAVGDGVVDHDTYIPYAWIGDNDRGLFWLCESAQFWPNWTSSNAFETVRAGEQTTLRLNLLQPGQTLPANWEFEFGLQATPVKPLPAHWRQWRWGSTRPTLAYTWSTPATRSYYGYPDGKDPAFTKEINDLRAKGIRVIPYSILHMISDGCPEFLWFGDRWHAGDGCGDFSSSDVMSMGGPLRSICPRSAEQADLKFSDFIVWKNKQYMEQYRLDGFYHDCANPTFCIREGEGHEKCGWLDAAGKRHWNTNILPWRNIYRRIYAMTKEVNPNCFLIAHVSPHLGIPFLAYEDARLDGEHFRGGNIKVHDDYMDVLPLDAFRAQFMGRQWGVVSFFLPELDAGLGMTERIEPTRGLAALLMLHDVAPLPAYSNEGVWKQMYDVLDAFGYADAEFIPYFDRVPPATTDLKDVYASVYKRADGHALVIVGNLSKEDRSGVVRLNGKRIGVPLENVISWPDKSPVKREGDRITLDIPRQGYKMLLIGNERDLKP